ncbi:uncharacterized protein LOC135934228 [Cloeon dipterum]|uniref:uncharacterized protein LOC135934228 n=1 Tax=Cloeon dipterum TaxID=197152 RepID=UPI00321F6D51
MMLVEQLKEEAWKSTLFINMALEKFAECNSIVKSQQEVECSYVHNFLKCFTNGSTSLEKFWNRDLHHLFDSREFAMTISKFYLDTLTTLDSDNGTPLIVSDLIKNKDVRLQQYIEYVDSQSFSEEFISSNCTFNLLRPKNMTLNDSCLAKEKYFEPIAGYDDILKIKNLKMMEAYPVMAAAAICHEANGSLITTADFRNISILINITSNVYKLYLRATLGTVSLAGSIDPNILVDEIYEDSKGVFRWCSTSAEVPKHFVGFHHAFVYTYDISKLKYDSRPVSPSLGQSSFITFFCKFEKSFLALCKTIA